MTDVFIRPDTQQVIELLAASDAPPMHEQSPQEAREAYVAMRYLMDAEPTPLAKIRDLSCPGPAGEIKLRYYDAREQREEGPAIIFFHGGGFVIGDLDTHHPFCTEMAAQMDLPLIAVDYRIGPEDPFPAAPDDAEAAARWIAENGAELGLQINGLILCGDSAGGNLTIVTEQSLRRQPAAVPVIAQVPFYPGVDTTDQAGSMQQFGDGYLLTRDSIDYFYGHYQTVDDDVRTNPILGELEGTPPTILMTAGLDPLRDQGRRYAARLIEAGVDVIYMEARGNIHGLIGLRKLIPSAQQDIDQVFAALKTVLQK